MHRQAWVRPFDLVRLAIAAILVAALLILTMRSTGGDIVSATTPVLTRPAGSGVFTEGELSAFEGTTDPGVTLQFFDGDRFLGEALGGSDGTFEFPVPAGLTQGPHSVRVVAVNRSNEELAASPPLAFTVVPAVEPVAVPVIISPADGASFAALEPLSFDGVAAPGATVHLYDGDALLGETIVDSEGKWRLLLSENHLKAGLHDLRAAVLNEAGNEVAASPAIKLSIEKPIVPPAFTELESGSTFSAHDLSTFRGTATSGTTVRLYDANVLLGELSVGDDDAWEFALLEPLSAGVHALQAVALDADGKEAGSSDVIELVVEEPAVAPVVVQPASEVSIAAGQSLSLEGTAAPGAELRLYDGDSLLGAAFASADGAWSFEVAGDLSPGMHSVRVVALDESGQEAASAQSFELTVLESIIEPAFLALDAGARFTTDEALVFQGTAAPVALLRLYDGDILLGEFSADEDGQWQFEVPEELSTGQHTLRVVVLDAAGEEAAASEAVEVLLEDTAVTPVVTGLPAGASFSAGEPVAFEGHAAPAAVVRLYDGETLLGETTADADGRWRFQLTEELSAGDHELTVVMLDTAGEESTTSEPVAFSIVLGAASPVIYLPETGNVRAGVPITGTAQPNARLLVYDGEALLGETDVDANGQWSLQLPDDLGIGEHTLRAVMVDEAGETVSESLPASFDMLELRLPITGIR